MGNSDHSNPRSQGAGDLADRGRAAVARVRARLHEGLAGHRRSSAPKGVVKATIDAWSGGKPGPWTQDEDDAPGSSTGRSPARAEAIDPDGLLYTRSCGGWRVDPLKAELGPIELGRRRRRLDAPCARRPRADRAVRLADGLLLEAVVVGRRDRRGVLRPQPDRDKRPASRGKPGKPASRQAARSRPRHRPVTAPP